MAISGIGNSAWSSMQTWAAKQKDFTTTYLNNAASLSDDIGSTILTQSQNMATFAGQMALARVSEAAAAKSATTVSNTADPFASLNAAAKLSQIVNGTDDLVSTATSTTDAAKTINQIINGTDKLMTTATSTTDAAKTVNQIIAGTDKLTANTAGSAIDMMSLTKIMYGIDKLPLPPKAEVTV